MTPKLFIAIAWLLVHRFMPEMMDFNGSMSMRHFVCYSAIANGCGYVLREPPKEGRQCSVIHEDEIPPCMRAVRLVCDLAFPPRDEIVFNFPDHTTVTYDGGKTEENIVLPPGICTSLNVRIAMLDAAELVDRQPVRGGSVAELLRAIDQYLNRTAGKP